VLAFKAVQEDIADTDAGNATDWELGEAAVFHILNSLECWSVSLMQGKRLQCPIAGSWLSPRIRIERPLVCKVTAKRTTAPSPETRGLVLFGV
jgi:hypothetical protein